MRLNMPVTNLERVMRDGEYIVSRTDTRGIITYVNPYFVEISGFPESELIGAPHNIVRHPDMPAEAFKDLWDTLASGKPWTGYVKNRCKNGDHYWVLANATPIWENGVITGYLSVRSKPERAEVDAVSRVYAQFKSGRAKGLAIREGKVVKVSLTEHEVRGTLKPGALPVPEPGPGERLRHLLGTEGGAVTFVTTRIPAMDDSALLQELESAKVEFSGRIESTFWRDLLFGWVVPLGIIAALWIFYLRLLAFALFHQAGLTPPVEPS